EILSAYNLTKEEDLKTIALTLLEEDPKALYFSLPNFGIWDKDFLEELDERLKPYKITASLEKIKQHPSKISEILSAYNLTKEEDLKTIALALLDKDPNTLALSLPNFEIQDQDFLKELNEYFNPYKIISSTLSNRLLTVESELSRLKENPRIQKSLEKIKSSYHITLTNPQKVALAQSIELREKLKCTHYVLNHGQANNNIIVNILAKKITELFEAKKYEYFEILRHNVFLENIPKEQDVDWYKNKMKYDIDHKYRKELICADIRLENTDGCESAIDFFARGFNIASSHDSNFTLKIIEQVTRKYFNSNEKLTGQVSGELTLLSEKLTGSTLYSICIPKTKFGSLGYLSGPYGRPSAGTYDLDSLQDGTSSLSSQVRLLTAKLDPKEGIFILPHSTLTTEEFHKIESVVEKCLLRAKAQLECVV
ncbi:MAG: hypothetical protein V4489_04290, partial [Chlamydiota bacterium]